MSARPMEGVRVIEVAAWTFVPAAGGVLAEWGADVIKIEHPLTGDPQRGLVVGGMAPGDVNFIVEIPNRGKRSVGVDLQSERGRELLDELLRDTDVFLTNFLPSTRRRLRIDVDDVRAVNPNIIYVRGSGSGVRGPDADKGAYDATSYWARASVGSLISTDDEYPRRQPIAFGDIAGAQTIAGGIAAALFAREKTGEPSTVDVSLLSYGLWNASPHIVQSKLLDIPDIPKHPRSESPNPIVGAFKTADDRFLQLVMLQSDRYWARLCQLLNRPDLVNDERFIDHRARFNNNAACVAELDLEFGRRTLTECIELLQQQEGPWAVYQKPLEIFDDPQVQANGFVRSVAAADGSLFDLVANPVQFDESPPTLVRAPEMGEHTEDVLLELGLTWADLADLKDAKVIS